MNGDLVQQESWKSSTPVQATSKSQIVDTHHTVCLIALDLFGHSSYR